MYEGTDALEDPPTYLKGDIVWVKLGGYWWPGEVKHEEDIPGDLSDFKKPPLVIVKFFDEDSYEYIRHWSNIYPYNCDKKSEFIKKGMAGFRAKLSHMTKFPRDIGTAEEKTDGNPNILSQPEYLPVKKINYNEIFGTPSPKKSTKGKTTSSASKKPTSKDNNEPIITHRRFLGNDDYRAYICIQYPGKDRAPGSDDEEIQKLNQDPEELLTCQACPFTTKRLGIMLMHTKMHLEGVYISAKRKNKKEREIELTDSETEAVVTKPSKPKHRKKKVEAKPKSAVNVFANLLEEWDDTDDDMDEEKTPTRTKKQVIESEDPRTDVELEENVESKDVEEDKSTTNHVSDSAQALDTPKSPSSGKNTHDDIKNCFDFEEEEEDDDFLFPASTGRKIPRVIPEKPRASISELLELTQKEDELAKEQVSETKGEPEKPSEVSEPPEVENDENKKEIVQTSQSFDRPQSVDNVIDKSFKELMEETEVPPLEDLTQILKPEQNFHDARTIKFPDKGGTNLKGGTSPKSGTSKRRFVTSFEDFEAGFRKIGDEERKRLAGDKEAKRNKKSKESPAHKDDNQNSDRQTEEFQEEKITPPSSKGLNIVDVPCIEEDSELIPEPDQVIIQNDDLVPTRTSTEGIDSKREPRCSEQREQRQDSEVANTSKAENRTTGAATPIESRRKSRRKTKQLVIEEDSEEVIEFTKENDSDTENILAQLNTEASDKLAVFDAEIEAIKKDLEVKHDAFEDNLKEKGGQTEMSIEQLTRELEGSADSADVAEPNEASQQKKNRRKTRPSHVIDFSLEEPASKRKGRQRKSLKEDSLSAQLPEDNNLIVDEKFVEKEVSPATPPEEPTVKSRRGRSRGLQEDPSSSMVEVPKSSQLDVNILSVTQNVDISEPEAHKEDKDPIYTRKSHRHHKKLSQLVDSSDTELAPKKRDKLQKPIGDHSKENTEEEQKELTNDNVALLELPAVNTTDVNSTLSESIHEESEQPALRRGRSKKLEEPIAKVAAEFPEAIPESNVVNLESQQDLKNSENQPTSLEASIQENDHKESPVEKSEELITKEEEFQSKSRKSNRRKQTEGQILTADDVLIEDSEVQKSPKISGKGRPRKQTKKEQDVTMVAETEESDTIKEEDTVITETTEEIIINPTEILDQQPASTTQRRKSRRHAKEEVAESAVEVEAKEPHIVDSENVQSNSVLSEYNVTGPEEHTLKINRGRPRKSVKNDETSLPTIDTPADSEITQDLPSKTKRNKNETELKQTSDSESVMATLSQELGSKTTRSKIKNQTEEKQVPNSDSLTATVSEITLEFPSKTRKSKNKNQTEEIHTPESDSLTATVSEIPQEFPSKMKKSKDKNHTEEIHTPDSDLVTAVTVSETPQELPPSKTRKSKNKNQTEEIHTPESDSVTATMSEIPQEFPSKTKKSKDKDHTEEIHSPDSDLVTAVTVSETPQELPPSKTRKSKNKNQTEEIYTPESDSLTATVSEIPQEFPSKTKKSKDKNHTEEKQTPDPDLVTVTVSETPQEPAPSKTKKSKSKNKNQAEEIHTPDSDSIIATVSETPQEFPSKTKKSKDKNHTEEKQTPDSDLVTLSVLETPQELASKTNKSKNKNQTEGFHTPDSVSIIATVPEIPQEFPSKTKKSKDKNHTEEKQTPDPDLVTVTVSETPQEPAPSKTKKSKNKNQAEEIHTPDPDSIIATVSETPQEFPSKTKKSKDKNHIEEKQTPDSDLVTVTVSETPQEPAASKVKKSQNKNQTGEIHTPDSDSIIATVSEIPQEFLSKTKKSKDKNHTEEKQTPDSDLVTVTVSETPQEPAPSKTKKSKNKKQTEGIHTPDSVSIIATVSEIPQEFPSKTKKSNDKNHTEEKQKPDCDLVTVTVSETPQEFPSKTKKNKNKNQTEEIHTPESDSVTATLSEIAQEFPSKAKKRKSKNQAEEKQTPDSAPVAPAVSEIVQELPSKTKKSKNKHQTEEKEALHSDSFTATVSEIVEEFPSEMKKSKNKDRTEEKQTTDSDLVTETVCEMPQEFPSKRDKSKNKHQTEEKQTPDSAPVAAVSEIVQELPSETKKSKNKHQTEEKEAPHSDSFTASVSEIVEDFPSEMKKSKNKDQTEEKQTTGSDLVTETVCEIPQEFSSKRKKSKNKNQIEEIHTPDFDLVVATVSEIPQEFLSKTKKSKNENQTEEKCTPLSESISATESDFAHEFPSKAKKPGNKNQTETKQILDSDSVTPEVLNWESEYVVEVTTGKSESKDERATDVVDTSATEDPASKSVLELVINEIEPLKSGAPLSSQNITFESVPQLLEKPTARRRRGKTRWDTEDILSTPTVVEASESKPTDDVDISIVPEASTDNTELSLIPLPSESIVEVPDELTSNIREDKSIWHSEEESPAIASDVIIDQTSEDISYLSCPKELLLKTSEPSIEGISFQCVDTTQSDELITSPLGESAESEKIDKPVPESRLNESVESLNCASETIIEPSLEQIEENSPQIGLCVDLPSQETERNSQNSEAEADGIENLNIDKYLGPSPLLEKCSDLQEDHKTIDSQSTESVLPDGRAEYSFDKSLEPIKEVTSQIELLSDIPLPDDKEPISARDHSTEKEGVIDESVVKKLDRPRSKGRKGRSRRHKCVGKSSKKKLISGLDSQPSEPEAKRRKSGSRKEKARSLVETPFSEIKEQLEGENTPIKDTIPECSVPETVNKRDKRKGGRKHRREFDINKMPVQEKEEPGSNKSIADLSLFQPLHPPLCAAELTSRSSKDRKRKLPEDFREFLYTSDNIHDATDAREERRRSRSHKKELIQSISFLEELAMPHHTRAQESKDVIAHASVVENKDDQVSTSSLCLIDSTVSSPRKSDSVTLTGIVSDTTYGRKSKEIRFGKAKPSRSRWDVISRLELNEADEMASISDINAPIPEIFTDSQSSKTENAVALPSVAADSDESEKLNTDDTNCDKKTVFGSLLEINDAPSQAQKVAEEETLSIQADIFETAEEGREALEIKGDVMQIDTPLSAPEDTVEINDVSPTDNPPDQAPREGYQEGILDKPENVSLTADVASNSTCEIGHTHKNFDEKAVSEPDLSDLKPLPLETDDTIVGQETSKEAILKGHNDADLPIEVIAGLTEVIEQKLEEPRHKRKRRRSRKSTTSPPPPRDASPVANNSIDASVTCDSIEDEVELKMDSSEEIPDTIISQDTEIHSIEASDINTVINMDPVNQKETLSENVKDVDIQLSETVVTDIPGVPEVTIGDSVLSSFNEGEASKSSTKKGKRGRPRKYSKDKSIADEPQNIVHETATVEAIELSLENSAPITTQTNSVLSSSEKFESLGEETDVPIAIQEQADIPEDKLTHPQNLESTTGAVQAVSQDDGLSAQTERGTEVKTSPSEELVTTLDEITPTIAKDKKEKKNRKRSQSIDPDESLEDTRKGRRLRNSSKEFEAFLEEPPLNILLEDPVEGKVEPSPVEETKEFPIRGKRGRLRKYSRQDSISAPHSEASTDDTSELVKEESANQSDQGELTGVDTKIAAAEPVLPEAKDIAVVEKRGRGRPRKYSKAGSDVGDDRSHELSTISADNNHEEGTKVADEDLAAILKNEPPVQRAKSMPPKKNRWSRRSSYTKKDPDNEPESIAKDEISQNLPQTAVTEDLVLKEQVGVLESAVIEKTDHSSVEANTPENPTSSFNDSEIILPLKKSKRINEVSSQFLMDDEILPEKKSDNDTLSFPNYDDSFMSTSLRNNIEGLIKEIDSIDNIVLPDNLAMSSGDIEGPSTEHLFESTPLFDDSRGCLKEVLEVPKCVPPKKKKIDLPKEESLGAPLNHLPPNDLHKTEDKISDNIPQPPKKKLQKLFENSQALEKTEKSIDIPLMSPLAKKKSFLFHQEEFDQAHKVDEGPPQKDAETSKEVDKISDLPKECPEVNVDEFLNLPKIRKKRKSSCYEDYPLKKEKLVVDQSEAVVKQEHDQNSLVPPILTTVNDPADDQNFIKEIKHETELEGSDVKSNIQTNLSIPAAPKEEDLFMIATHTLSDIKDEVIEKSDTVSPLVPAKSEEQEPVDLKDEIDIKQDDVISPLEPVIPAEPLNEAELVPISVTPTVMSEQDLADAQVEITMDKVISEKKPTTLGTFSMDFPEPLPPANIDVPQDVKKGGDGTKKITETVGTEFTSKAMVKEFDNRPLVSQPNAYVLKSELLDILEGNSNSSTNSSGSEQKFKTSFDNYDKKSTVQCIIDFEEAIPSQIVLSNKVNPESVLIDSPKLLERLSMSTDGATGKVQKVLIQSDIKVPEGLSKTLMSKIARPTGLPKPGQKIVIKTTRPLVSSAPKATGSKPIILSEQIIRPAKPVTGIVKPQGVKRQYEDVEDVETAFIIPKIAKKAEDEDVVVPTTPEKPVRVRGSKASGKAKILQQTIITPKGEVIPQTTTTTSAQSIQLQPVQVHQAPDDSVFDINSMPIVLSDDLLTPESIQNMPVVLSEDVLPQGATVATAKPQDKLLTKKIVTTMGTKQIIFKTTQPASTTPVPAKHAGKPRILSTSGATIHSKVTKPVTTALLATGTTPDGKTAKYVLVPPSVTPATTQVKTVKQTVVKKQPVVQSKLTTSGVTPAADQSNQIVGNKIMIVTNAQGQQTRVVLTPQQQKAFMQAQTGSKTKAIIKGAIPKALLESAAAVAAAGPSGVVAKTVAVVTQGATPTVTSHGGLLMPAIKTVKTPVPPKKGVQRTSTTKPQKTILIKNQMGQTVRKIQGTDDADLDRQVAEQLEAIKASARLHQANKSPEIINYTNRPIPTSTNRATVRKSYPKKVDAAKIKIPVSTPQVDTQKQQESSVPALAPLSPQSRIPQVQNLTPQNVIKQGVPRKVELPVPSKSLETVLQRQQTTVPVESDYKQSAALPTDTESKRPESPLRQVVIQDGLGNLTTVTVGQILAIPSETVDGQPQSYMLVTVDESGNLTPLNNDALMSLDPSLGAGGDINNMVLQVDQGQGTVAAIKPAEAGAPSLPAPPVEEKRKVEERIKPVPTKSIPVKEPKVAPVEKPKPQEAPLAVEQQIVIGEGVLPGDAGGQQLIVTGDPLATQKFLESLSDGSTDLANILANADGGSVLIQADGQQILIRTNQAAAQPLLAIPESTEGGGNPLFGAHKPNQDILAAALANTDVFQPTEQQGNQSSALKGLPSTQLSPGSALYPMHVGNVLETSLTLNSPIMTPLEVPSTNTKKIDDKADILNQVPKNVDLPITITDPNITQTVAHQQAAGLMELALPLSDTEPGTDISSPSYSYSLPTLDDTVGMSQKPFNSSMPLLTEDVMEAESSNCPDRIRVRKGLESVPSSFSPNFGSLPMLSGSIESSREEVVKTSAYGDIGSLPLLTDDVIEDSGSSIGSTRPPRSSPKPIERDIVDEGLSTLGGEMCSSLSEPPPDMFDLSSITPKEEEISSDMSSIPEPETLSINSENSGEIPIQPPIVASLNDLKRSGEESEGSDEKRARFD